MTQNHPIAPDPASQAVAGATLDHAASDGEATVISVAAQTYAELHCISNFTFLRGASFPEELVDRADSLGYSAIAITDECSLSGVVKAHMAAKERRIKLIVGSEFVLRDTLVDVADEAENQRYRLRIANRIASSQSQGLWRTEPPNNLCAQTGKEGRVPNRQKIVSG